MQGVGWWMPGQVQLFESDDVRDASSGWSGWTMTDPARPHVSVDAGRLWGGGVATGLVAALGAVLGVLICSIVDVRLVRPAFLLDLLHTFAGDYALTAFVLTLVATGVAHLMALVTPRPR